MSENITNEKDVWITPIGRIRTPFSSAQGTPIQPAYAADAEGTVILDEHLEPALLDIEGFERIWLIYILDRAEPFKPQVIPYRDDKPHGLFATRSPCRPNAIGMSVVRLVGRDKNVLHVLGIDVLDRTPLIDIKPYVPEFDAYPSASAGWFETAASNRTVADNRFHSVPTLSKMKK